MSEAAQTDEWNRAALLMVLIANPNRDVKKRPKPFGLEDFHPFIKRVKKKRKSAAEIFSTFGMPETVTETTWQKHPQAT